MYIANITEEREGPPPPNFDFFATRGMGGRKYAIKYLNFKKIYKKEGGLRSGKGGGINIKVVVKRISKIRKSKKRDPLSRERTPASFAKGGSPFAFTSMHVLNIIIDRGMDWVGFPYA